MGTRLHVSGIDTFATCTRFETLFSFHLGFLGKIFFKEINIF